MKIIEEIKRHYAESKRIINEAQREGRLVLFVGAGASIAAGMPTWGEAIEKIAIRLGINNVSINDYLLIPQYYYNARDKKEYTELMQDIFLYRQYLPDKSVHELIIQFNTQTIITTNYDHLLEQAAEHNSEMIRVISKDSDLPYRRGGRELIKMHGDFENDNFVLKEEDYLNYSKNFKLIENYIKSIIGTKVVLFIGYSFNDPDVKQIFSWAKEILHGDFQNAYLINTHDNYNIDSEKYYKKFGINILYSSVQFDSKYEKTNETLRLESMLKWLLEKDKKTKLDDLYDDLRVFRDFNYAYMSRIENAFKKRGYVIDRGYIALESIPGHKFNYIKDYDVLDHIIKAITYERYIQNAEAVYVVTEDNDKKTYIIGNEYEASCEEKESVQGLLDILNKSGFFGLIFFVPIDKDHPLLEGEVKFFNKYHRIFVLFDNEEVIPQWLNYVYTFDDKNLEKLINYNNKRLNESTPDLYMEQASIHSYFEDFLSAYNCLRTASSLYYKRGERVKYFIAETDRYYIGKIIRESGRLLGITESDIADVSKEIETINLERTYLSLPNLGKGSEVLKDIFSFDISYRLFQDTYKTNEEVKEQALTKYRLFSGLEAFSSMRRDVLDFHNFEIRNHIILDRYRENNLIYKLYFQSMISSVIAPDIGNEDNEGEVFNVHAETITKFELYIALKYITYKDLQKILSDVKKIPVEEESYDYIKEILNCIDKPHTEWIISHDIPFWKLILLLGHIDFDNIIFKNAMEKMCRYVVGTNCRDYKNAIIKIVENAETLDVIDENNICNVRNILDETMKYLSVSGKTETRSLLNMVTFLAYICHEHGEAYDDNGIINSLLSNDCRDLCLEIYPFIGYDEQETVKRHYNNWKLTEKYDDCIVYILAVGNDVIQMNDEFEKVIIKFIRSEKERIEKEKSTKGSKGEIIPIGTTQPDYIQLLRQLCDLNLRNLIFNKDLFIQTVKDVDDDFSSWLIDIEAFDYVRFDIKWLDLCRKPLLEKIGKNDVAREEISKRISAAYHKGIADKRIMDKYFKIFQ